MLTYEEFDLYEHAVAGYGDWVPNRDRVATRTLRVMKADWVFQESVEIKGVSLDIYKFKDSDTYIMGVMSPEEFNVAFFIEFKERKDIASEFKGLYKHIYNVDGVMVKENQRGSGFATFFYRWFVDKGNTIIGDEIQYHKARLLWKKLSFMDDLVVDIVDIDKGEVIEKNVHLHHGEADWEFDERVWDYADIKKHIRVILTKVPEEK